MSIWGDKAKGKAKQQPPALPAGLIERHARAAKLEEKQREKDAAQNAKQSAQAERREKKEKFTKTIVASAERKRRRERAAHDGENMAGSSVRVWRQLGPAAGAHITEGMALFEILEFLQQRPNYAEAEIEDIRDGVGIDLGAHPDLLETLRSNRKVEALEERGRLQLRFLPAYGVRDRASLQHLLKLAYPGAADGHTEAVRRDELTQYHETEVPGAPPAKGAFGKKDKKEVERVYETFPEIQTELDEMIQSGRCSMLVRTDTKKEVLYAPIGERASEPASEAMRKLWHGARVPAGDELQSVLLQRKVRKHDEFVLRQQFKAEELRARQEAAAQKKRRAPTFRTVTNAHLVAEDPSLFGGALRGQAAAMAAEAQARKAAEQKKS